MNRCDELTLKLIDQTATAEELAELVGLTESTADRNAMFRLIDLEALLQVSEKSSIVEPVIRRLQKDRSHRIEEAVMKTIAQPTLAVVDEATSPIDLGQQQPQDSWHLRIRLALALSALAVSLLFVASLFPTSVSTSAIARLETLGSSVRVLDLNGEPRSLTDGGSIKIYRDDTVEVSQAFESSEIVYSDGTRIEILGDTRVRLSLTTGGAKQLTVLTGIVRADVAPQPANLPLRIVTRSATLEVLGTTLGVEVRDAMTQLEVASGRVAMTREVDGERVEVEAGRYAKASESANEPLQSLPMPELPKSWSEDFESTLPNGWISGEYFDGDSVQGVRAIPTRSKERRFVVTTHNAWTEGQHALCAIDQDSVLHLRFRQSKAARITVMVAARCYPPTEAGKGANLFYTLRAWNADLPADTWRTISIPLKDAGWHLIQGIKKGGAPDLDGLAAYLIHVTTMEQDIGLAIDRMWITNSSDERQP